VSCRRLHIDYKKSRIKQYHKLLEALRTETTINDTRDFGIGRRLENLAELRKIGFAANRRLLDVQRIGHDCFLGEAAFQDLQKPVKVGEQRAAALRFADPRVQGLLHVLLLFLLVQGTFRNKDLREHIAPLLGIKPSQLSPGRVTYDLRRLRLHGLIERIPKTHSYRITAKGLRTAIFYTRLYNRSLRTGLALISPDAANANTPIVRSIRAAEAALNTCWTDGFAELELAARERGNGVTLGGRVTGIRQQPKGVLHVSIAPTNDRRHEAGRTVSSYSCHLHQCHPRSCRPLSSISGRAQRGGGSRLSPEDA
jgi:DNA-binding HxlR family transcriptional regulator